MPRTTTQRAYTDQREWDQLAKESGIMGWLVSGVEPQCVLFLS